MEDEGEDVMEHLVKKYGPAALKNFGDANSGLNRMGKRVGIAFNNKRKMYPTLKAHALMEDIKASDNGKANQFMEEMYEQYFVEGANINSVETLATIAAKFGIDAQHVERVCNDEGKKKDILLADRKVKQGGVSGVPFFRIHPNDGGIPTAFSGAQPPDVIAEQLQLAADP